MTEQKNNPPGGGGFCREFDPSKVNTKIYSRDDQKQERFRQKREEKYREALNNLPPRGGGLHGALMGVCNLGVRAQVDEHTMYEEIIATGRAFKRGEVADAINKAMQDAGRSKRVSFQRTVSTPAELFGGHLQEHPETALRIRDNLIRKGGSGEIDPFSEDLWDRSSPHPESFPRSGELDGSECCADMLLFLRELYRPDDLLYIGSRYEKHDQQRDHIKTADEWISFFTSELDAIKEEPNAREQFYKIRSLAVRFPFIIVNPLTGQPLDNGSFRCDANVAEYRYAVVEADGKDLPSNMQLSLLAGLRLPIVALTFSGSKSLHALIDVTRLNGGKHIKNQDEWRRVVKEWLFKLIVPLGFDGQDSNPSRLSRLPGIWREENVKFQQLLYINKKGEPFYV